MEFVGQVRRRRVSAGSKSERAAVTLVTDSGEYVLRRHAGNPFRDPVLEGLVGKTIRGEGRLTGTTLVLTGWTVEPGGP